MAKRKRRPKTAKPLSHSAKRLILSLILIAFACTVITITGRWGYVLEGLGLKEVAAQPSEGLEVHMIDVGNADAILIRQGTQSMLIDAGDVDDAPTVLRYLRDRHITRLDYVIATHAHADHIGGMTQVLQEMDVGEFLMATMPEGFEPTTRTYQTMLTTLLKKKVTVTEAAPGQSYALGDATVEILGPAQTFFDMNNMSVVCRLTFGSRRFLFMGDAEKPAEQAILDGNDVVRADVLKVGHHGSNTSSAEAFLQEVSPEIALIPCGYGNEYGHPHAETTAALARCGATVYRSDLCGTIVVTTDGEDLHVECEKTA